MAYVYQNPQQLLREIPLRIKIVPIFLQKLYNSSIGIAQISILPNSLL